MRLESIATGEGETATLIALYGNHHDLPFWGSDSYPNWGKPWGLLSGVGHPLLEAEFSEGRDIMPLRHTPPGAVLLGLLKINLPRAMAHVSIGQLREGVILPPHRMRVQISTEADIDSAAGLPIVMSHGPRCHPVVRCLWGADNGTYRPWGLLDQEASERRLVAQRGNYEADFWASFFTTVLRGVRDAQIGLLAELSGNLTEVTELLGVLTQLP